MKVNSVYSALISKGPTAFSRRLNTITRRYGFTSDAMDRGFAHFLKILQIFNCVATFPVTAVAFKRNPITFKKLQNSNIELAVHGYTHIDYSLLNPNELNKHLNQALAVFAHEGITPQGFRSPYLKTNSYLHSLAGEAGFAYVSNQPYFWDVLDTAKLQPAILAGLTKAIDYYAPWRSSERLSLPFTMDNIVEIPVSLPDDEILVERLGFSKHQITATWLAMLHLSYRRGELFVLQLHPERISICADCLRELLSEAVALKPRVWCTTLAEIAAWWKGMNNASVEISTAQPGQYRAVVKAPHGASILARGIDMETQHQPLSNGDLVINSTDFCFKSPMRPVIGLSPRTSSGLLKLLKEAGYIIETCQSWENYSYYFDIPDFDFKLKYSLLDEINNGNRPLVRFSRWPGCSQSALVVTGDIDAVTIWDYGLRFFGN